MIGLAFVGSYAGADRPGIHAFRFDAAAETLQPVGSWPGVENPSFLAVLPGGKSLFSVGETRNGTVHSFGMSIDEDGVPGLEHIAQQSSEGDAPCHLAVDPTGRWLSVANYGTGTVAVLPIDADGALGPATAVEQHTGSGPHPTRQQGPHAHSTVFSPDGTRLIAADLGIDRLLVYAFDPDDGSIDVTEEIATAPGSGPRHMAFSPDGSVLFAVGELDNTLSSYRYDDGSLAHVASESTLEAPNADSIGADLHLDSSGARAYVSNRGADTIATFSIASDGRIERTGSSSCGGHWPRGFALSPDGGFVLVANRRSDEVALLPIEGAGAGAPVARVAVPEPSNIVFV